MQRAFAVALLVLTGCAEEDDTPACPGVSSPVVLELTDVSPAAGASVPNDAIVHAFTITTPVAFDTIAFALPAAHTAGQPTTELTFKFQQTDTGTVYTAEPMVWATAPAHVEFASAVVYETADGCGYRLPSPLFSYDITPP